MADDTLSALNATLWPFGPNWRAGVAESLDWQTQVIQAYDGTEQRIQLRTAARRGLEYEFMVTRSNARLLDRVLWGAQNKRIAVPVWPYRTRLNAEATSGATTLSVDHSLLGVSAGSLVLVMTNETTWEAAEVGSTGSGVINLSEALDATWPAGTRVYPLLVGLVRGNVPTVRQTDRATTGRLTFLGDPLLTDPFLPVVSAPVTYNSHEILLTKPNWKDGIQADNEYPFEINDYETGPLAYAETVDTPRPMRAFRWFLKSRQDIYNFRGFLRRRNGRQKAFYVPSWHDDFTLVDPIGSGDTTIRVVDDGFADNVGLDDARRHIMIRKPDGTYYLRQINNVAKDGTDVVLTISSALGAAVSEARFHLVSLYRLFSDTVNIEWRTDTVAEADTPLVLVKA